MVQTIIIVCDAHPNKQEQMPMEETGNMVRDGLQQPH